MPVPLLYHCTFAVLPACTAALLPQLLRQSEDSPLHSQPLWLRPELNQATLIQEFRRECHIVRRALEGDLNKAGRRGGGGLVVSLAVRWRRT